MYVHYNKFECPIDTTAIFFKSHLEHVYSNLTIAGLQFSNLKLIFNHCFDRHNVKRVVIHNQNSRLTLTMIRIPFNCMFFWSIGIFNTQNLFPLFQTTVYSLIDNSFRLSGQISYYLVHFFFFFVLFLWCSIVFSCDSFIAIWIQTLWFLFFLDLGLFLSLIFIFFWTSSDPLQLAIIINIIIIKWRLYRTPSILSLFLLFLYHFKTTWHGIKYSIVSLIDSDVFHTWELAASNVLIWQIILVV